MSAAPGVEPSVPGIDVARLTDWLRVQLPELEPAVRLHAHRRGPVEPHLPGRRRARVGASCSAARRSGEILASAHDMAREHVVLSALSAAGARVPRPLAFCEDVDVTGAPFYVMEHVDGLVLSTVATAETLDPEARASRRAGDGDDAGRVARRSTSTTSASTDLRRPESLASRQLRRWTRQWHASKTRELPLIDELAELFATRLPEEREQSLVHGDYHLGNALVAPGRGRAGDSRLGALHGRRPARRRRPDGRLLDGDVGGRHGGGRALPRARHRRCRASRPRRSSRTPTCGASGRDLADLGFWVAFAYWKVAIIVEGVYRRWLNDPANGSAAGRLQPAVARLADARVAMPRCGRDGWSDLGSDRPGR